MMAVFEKSLRLRHIGHLDIQRAMQRALRRSGLPVKYSQGFNPHILVTFASALSTGAVGLKELMDVTLEADVTEEVFLAAMNRALPPEMQIISCKAMDDKHPALMAMVCAASYDIQLMDAEATGKCAAAVEGFLAQETIPAMRKTKSGVKECDIKPLVFDLAVEGDHIFATMELTERSSCKPDMLVTALCGFAGCEIPRTLVTRTQLWGLNEAGQRAPLETL